MKDKGGPGHPKAPSPGLTGEGDEHNARSRKRPRLIGKILYKFQPCPFLLMPVTPDIVERVAATAISVRRSATVTLEPAGT